MSSQTNSRLHAHRPGPLLAGPPAPRRVVIDGRDDEEGRALLVISALHLCAPFLTNTTIDVLAPTEPAVTLAVRSLVWEEQLRVQCWPAELATERMIGASVYAAIVMQSKASLFMSEAISAGTPTLISVQFPRNQPRSSKKRQRLQAAHDTRAFAALLLDQVEAGPGAPWP